MKVKDISNVIWVRIIGHDVLDIQKYVISPCRHNQRRSGWNKKGAVMALAPAWHGLPDIYVIMTIPNP